MKRTLISSEDKHRFDDIIAEIRNNPTRFLNSIKDDIAVAIKLINYYDKKYILGGLSVKLIQSSSTTFHKLLEYLKISNNDLIKPDDDIETILEYALNISLSTTNVNSEIPTQKDIDDVYKILGKIKSNLLCYELSNVFSDTGIILDQWLSTYLIIDAMSTRGDGYFKHVTEIYKELFRPYNQFLYKHYKVYVDDIYKILADIDKLVYSKFKNSLGHCLTYERFTNWLLANGFDESMISEPIIIKFLEDNPDLCERELNKIVLRDHRNINGYNKLFWIIPKNEKEKIVFENLSQHFGDNSIFLTPNDFRAFPLNDTLINFKPLVKEDDKYFHFSTNLPFRNLFKITENLIKLADPIFYENHYRCNNYTDSKDNFIELKSKQLFEKLLPSTKFYHSLSYSVKENGVSKNAELDILGISDNTIYIIEVKAGQLNTIHRRGDLKGLKDKLTEIINVGSYQCHRALKYITEGNNPEFVYKDGDSKNTLKINTSNITEIFKISVTFEHFSYISANLKHLINVGILNSDYKWAWIISIYDLMIFSELIESEDDFIEYLKNRIALYDRNDVEFTDEINLLGYFLEGNFPIISEKNNEIHFIENSKDKIDNYYSNLEAGLSDVLKPKRKK